MTTVTPAALGNTVKLDIPDLTLTDFVTTAWRARARRTAVVDATNGRVLRYGDIDASVRRAASGLRRAGMRPRDVVALCCPNSPAFVISFYGVLRAGGVVTTISPTVGEAEAAAQLADSDARWVLTNPDSAERLTRAASGWSARVVELAHTGPKLPSGDDTPRSTTQPNDLAVLPYSSGTTGLPKGVELTHRSLLAGLCSLRDPEPVSEDDVVLAVLPMFHIAGMQIVMNHALARGATLVTLPRFDLAQFLGTIQRYRVTRFVAAPPIVLALAKHPLVDRYDLSSLRVIACGAAPLAPEVARAAAARLGCRIKQGYGLTEFAPIAMAPDDAPDRPESVGPPVAGVECRVVDIATGADVAPGSTGELLARSEIQMRGYLHNPQATAATIDRDGWLHTGDIVRLDHDGWIHVVDRVKELIKYKGHQVAPAELEAVLHTHPAVADAAVVGCPDEEAGELPTAFVVLRQPVPPAELVEFVAAHVDPVKKIRRVEIVDEIPKSPSGKIVRRLLKDRLR